MLALVSIIFIVISGIFVLLLLSVIAVYNNLAMLSNSVKSSWSDVDILLKKRYDLVAKLVETVKRYAPHEKSVFEETGRARSCAMKASARADKLKAESMLEETLKGFFAFTEEYPELKADANFCRLHSQFKELKENTENARRIFNLAVRDYNAAIATFPSNIIASLSRFEKEEFLELEKPGS